MLGLRTMFFSPSKALPLLQIGILLSVSTLPSFTKEMVVGGYSGRAFGSPTLPYIYNKDSMVLGQSIYA